MSTERQAMIDLLMRDFEEPASTFEGIDILFYDYESGGYDGDCLVIFERLGKLFEVHASHCSCYGLEGQWDPEETSIKELCLRYTGNKYASHGAEVRAWLEKYK